MTTVQMLRVRIREGYEEEMIGWVRRLEQRTETHEALRAEHVLVESVFLEQCEGRSFLWVYQRVEDVRQANEVFLGSNNPVDVELRALMERTWEKVDFFSPAFDYAAR